MLGLLLVAFFPSTSLAQPPTQPNESESSDIEESDETQPSESESSDIEAPDETQPNELESSDIVEEDEPGVKTLGIEEILVEGTRSDTELMDEPISFVQFGAQDIKSLRIQNVADLSAYTPNLEINTNFAASNPTLFIRGVGLKDYNSNSTGAVGIWHDGIMKNSPSGQLFALYDIDSIEVLRGPLGGIGGRNATAGAIRIHSRKPTGEWASNASFTYGNLNNIMFEGGLGFPINDMVSARIAFVTEFRDGYTNNTCADWDPPEWGFLPSTEEATREFFDLLDPSTEAVPTTAGDRFVYHNLEAIEVYNDAPQQPSNINLIQLLDGPGGTPGTVVGRQAAAFAIGADNVCLLEKAGALNTFAGFLPPGGWRASKGAVPLSQFQGLQDTYNDVEYYGARAQLDFQLTDDLNILVSAHWGANRSDSHHLQSVGAAPQSVADPSQTVSEPLGYFQSGNSVDWNEIRQDFLPFERPELKEGLNFVRGAGGEEGDPGFAGSNHFNGFYSSDGDEDLDLLGFSLNATWEHDWGRVLFVSGYEENQRLIQDEGDACPCLTLEAELDDESWQVTQDIRMEGEGDNYTWALGAFYIHEELVSQNRFSFSRRFNIIQDYDQTTDGWNLGAEFHYDFLEEGATPWLYQLSLDGGARYNWERKDFSLGTTLIRIFKETDKQVIPKDFVNDIWQDPTGEITFSYKPLEDLRIYAKYTRGYKAGHFNAGITVDPDGGTELQFGSQLLEPVEPEVINAAEIGFRSSWLDDRIQLSGALFRYWYDELQVFDIVNEDGKVPTQQLLNADADVLGAEIDMSLRPIEGLLIQGGVGWLDSEFGDFEVNKTLNAGNPMAGQPPTNGTFQYKGNPLIAAPDWSISAYVEYELPLSRFGSLIPSYDFSYKTRTYLDPQFERLISQPSYWLHNARLAYTTPGGSFEIAGWVQNFLDEEYKIDAFDETREFQQVLEVWSEPRTYGVTISHTW